MAPDRWTARLLAALTLAPCACDRAVTCIEPESVGALPEATVVSPSPSQTVPHTTDETAPAPTPSVSTSKPAKLPLFGPWPDGYEPPKVWQTKDVVVDGVTEQWSLEWTSPPDFNGCFGWSGCYCEGVEWGLMNGELALVRRREGAEIDRLDLTTATEELGYIPYTDHPHGSPTLPGFVPPAGLNRFGMPPGSSDMEAAPLSTAVTWERADAMRFVDYDHDGRATEFTLKVYYVACYQDPSVVVGISKARPRLHVFSSVESPKVPIVMTYPREWQAIARAKGKVNVSLHDCGDHGGTGVFANLWFDGAGIHFAYDEELECDWVHRRVIRKLRAKP